RPKGVCRSDTQPTAAFCIVCASYEKSPITSTSAIFSPRNVKTAQAAHPEVCRPSAHSKEEGPRIGSRKPLPRPAYRAIGSAVRFDEALRGDRTARPDPFPEGAA